MLTITSRAHTLIPILIGGLILSFILIAGSSLNVVAYEKEDVVVSIAVSAATSSTSTSPLPVSVFEENEAFVEPQSETVVPVPQIEGEEADVALVTVDSEFAIRNVPFYSQFTDITDASWKKVGCGIASLAMLISFYDHDVSVDALLEEGIAAGAYLNDAGWTYAGLIGISKKYGLSGTTRDLTGMKSDAAYEELKEALTEGPVMASVHYTFVPTNPIPHLVIINEIKDGKVYYNDPSEDEGGNSIAVEKFRASWKQRFIEFYPVS